MAALAEVVGEPQYGLSNASASDGEVPIVGMKDMVRGRIDISALARTTVTARERVAFRLKPGDLLLNRTNSRDLVGKLAVWDHPPAKEAVFASYLVRYPERPEVAIPRYVLACLEQAQAQQQIERLITPGVSQANINPSAFYEDVAIPLAPVPEQRRIVAALEVWDQAIDRTRALIDIKRRVLDERIRLAFLPAHDEAVSLPAGWRRLPIATLADVVGGGTPDTSNQSLWNGEVAWCTPTDLSSLRTRFIYETARQISAAGLNASSASVLPENSIVLSSRASVGACAINRVPMSTNQGFQSLVPKPATDSTFLYYLIKSSVRRLIRLAAGSTFLEFSGRELAKLVVAAPDLSEQLRVGRLLSVMDDEIDLLAARLEALGTQKRGLMQKLLTGERQLVQAPA
jgi:type I restriction enzyme S subunit